MSEAVEGAKYSTIGSVPYILIASNSDSSIMIDVNSRNGCINVEVMKCVECINLLQLTAEWV